MRLDRFDLNLLVVLDALLEERNVTRASERLFIGQSAARSALTKLRAYFGDELLMPIGRRLELTPLAKSLTEPVRDTLLRARAMLSLRPSFDPATVERRFSICASDDVIAVLLSAAVRRLAQQSAGLALELRTPARDVLDTFERGGLDLLIMPEQYVSKLSHPQSPLFEDTYVCMVWVGHELADEGLTMNDYLAQGHVAVRFGGERSITFEEWFLPRYGRQRRIECTVESFGALPHLLVGTQRVGTLPRRQADFFARTHPVRLLEPPFDMSPPTLTMAWPRHLDPDPAHAWLRQTIREVAKEVSDGHAAHDLHDDRCTSKRGSRCGEVRITPASAAGVSAR